jgi:tetratricopeptide (TPR) repeat protein
VRRALVALVATLALGLSAARAHADTPPTVWQRAENPDAGQAYQLHLKVAELLWQAKQPHNPLKNLLLESARSKLETGNAATSADVRLRFDLGDVYFELKRYREAISVLQPALATAPRDEGAAQGWLDLAFAAARLDRSSLELDGYDQYLATAVSARSDLSILSNRAEAEMRLGDLDAAVAGYRDVLEQGGHVYGVDPQILVLARWGLAVALDRNGDPAEAEHEAFVASEEDPEEQIIGDKDDVFFVPEYERDWYYALGRIQHAKHATDTGQALVCWSLVVDTWSHYVRVAVRGDRWVGLARTHLAAAILEQRAAAARFAKANPGARTLPRRPRPC